MKKFLCYSLVSLLIAATSSSIRAQNQVRLNESKHKVGFLYGQGNQNLLNVRYDYRVKLFQLQYFYSPVKKPGWSLGFLAQPQLNFSRYKPIDNVEVEENGYEVGLNLGALVRKNIYKEIVTCYIGLSFGPHYVSGTPARQTSGFIFSDNVFIGLTVRLDKNIHFDFRPGFRHISNANLVKPNRGVNNIIISGGIIVDIGRKR